MCVLFVLKQKLNSKTKTKENSQKNVLYADTISVKSVNNFIIFYILRITSMCLKQMFSLYSVFCYFVVSSGNSTVVNSLLSVIKFLLNWHINIYHMFLRVRRWLTTKKNTYWQINFAISFLIFFSTNNTNGIFGCLMSKTSYTCTIYRYFRWIQINIQIFPKIKLRLFVCHLPVLSLLTKLNFILKIFN